MRQLMQKHLYRRSKTLLRIVRSLSDAYIVLGLLSERYPTQFIRFSSRFKDLHPSPFPLLWSGITCIPPPDSSLRAPRYLDPDDLDKARTILTTQHRRGSSRPAPTTH